MSLLVLCLCVGCSNQTPSTDYQATSEQTEADNDHFEWQSQTIYDEHDIRITIDQVEIDRADNVILTIHMDNQCSENVMLSFADASIVINGFVAASNSEFHLVGAGQSGDGEVRCWLSGKANECVQTVAKLSLSDVVIKAEDEYTVLYTLPTIEVGIPGREHIVQQDDESGELLLTFAGIQLYLKEVDYSEKYLRNMYEVINMNDYTVKVYFQNIGINGYMCDEWGKDYGIWPTLPAGSRAYEKSRIELPPNPTFLEEGVELSWIADVKEISFDVVVENVPAHEYQTSETITIQIQK